MKEIISKTSNLETLEGEVKRLIIDGNKCGGVMVGSDEDNLTSVFSKATIITTGTFMNGVMHVGFKQSSGGRRGRQGQRGT